MCSNANFMTQSVVLSEHNRLQLELHNILSSSSSFLNVAHSDPRFIELFSGRVPSQHNKRGRSSLMNLQKPHESEAQSIARSKQCALRGLLCRSAWNSFPGRYRFIWLCFFWTGTPEKREQRSQEGSAAYPRWPPHWWRLCNGKGYSRSAQRVIRVQFNNLRGKTKSAVFLHLEFLWSLVSECSLLPEHQLGVSAGRLWRKKRVRSVLKSVLMILQSEWALLGQLSLACHLSVSSALLDIYLPCGAACPLAPHWSILLFTFTVFKLSAKVLLKCLFRFAGLHKRIENRLKTESNIS